MCGIVGTYPERDKKTVIQGVERLKHRGPDHDAIIKTDNGTLGHTRLSIIDVAKGDQPMSQDDSWIVFNGEVYNYRQLRQLVSLPFNTEGDTEVVLQLYRQLGPSCVSLLDGMFAFAILDGQSLFLARDPLGIKPLYYVTSGDRLYFASEIKALYEISTEVSEFPAGHWWHSDYGLSRFYQLRKPALFSQDEPAEAAADSLHDIRARLQAAVEKRMIADEDVPVGVSLSGGLDSSLVAAFAREGRAQLNTFVVGVAGSQDMAASLEMADYLGTRHHCYEYTFDEMVSVLPEVIYHLESFDAALVRSAIPNYFLAKLASRHVKVMLTGEGADELYAGYAYFQSFEDPDSLQDEMETVTGNLHNTNLQRADRMSMAHGLEARVPFLDQEFVDFSLALPAAWKMHGAGKAEKELLRNACRGLVPEEILNRPKQKFSDGAGSMDMLGEYARQQIGDEEFARQRQLDDGFRLRSKEELYYYQIFRGMFGEGLDVCNVGRTRSITKEELN